MRYTEDGTDVCVGLLDGSIKIVNPATSQIINNLANDETGTESQPVTCIRTKAGHDTTHIIGAAYASGIVRSEKCKKSSLRDPSLKVVLRSSKVES